MTMNKKFLAYTSGFLAAMALLGCKPQETVSASSEQTQTVVKMLNGSGATFPAPLYTRWATDYKQATGVAVNYQGTGSSAGIDAVKKQTVDFGATDAPLSAEELSQAGFIQFPAVIGGVVPVYHVEGLEGLVLNGEVLGDIYARKITYWDDAKIAALNPSLRLPNLEIKVVRRSDGSGTTYMFTDYLAQVNEAWQAVGASKDPKWAEGTVGGKGNDGVAAAVKQLPGAIGYVEYAYAKKNGMTTANLVNRDGQIVRPTAENFAAAAASANWQSVAGMGISLNNQAGEKAWPITGATFILMPKTAGQPETSLAVLKFFDWALTQGQTQALSLEYIPLPDETVRLIKQQWAEVKDAQGQVIWQ